MMQKNLRRFHLLAVLPLLAVVLVSGCASQQTTPGGGVIIEAFEPDLPDAYSGELVTFSMRMRNTGSLETKQVFAEILGIDQEWYDPSDTAAYGGGPWYQREKEANEKECQYMLYRESHTYPLKLSAPNPLFGTPGEQHVCSWTLKAPKLTKDVSVTYDVFARVFYQYETTTIKAITILPRNELKNLLDNGGTVPVATSSTTNSPIALDIEAQSPVRFSGTNSVTFPIKITVNNVGEGSACYHESRIDQCRASQEPQYVWKKLRVEIEEDNGLTLSNECGGGVELTLYQGKTNSIVCEVTIDDLPQSTVQKNIKVHASYFYFLDKAIQFTVTGK